MPAWPRMSQALAMRSTSMPVLATHTVEPSMEPAPAYSLSALARYFLAPGAFGFGGPIALAGLV
jgi:hypothetical protein